MKRIIDGVTYNTDTATPAATWEYENHDGYETTATLYQTRGGAFFIVHEWTVNGKAKVYFESTSRDEVTKLIERGNQIAILNEEILEDPPEAAEESTPGSTLYIRVPATLKTRLENLASEQNISLNAWTMRCVERCSRIEEIRSLLGAILHDALTLRSDPGAGAFETEAMAGIIRHMEKMANELASIFGWRGKDLEAMTAEVLGTKYRYIAQIDDNK